MRKPADLRKFTGELRRRSDILGVVFGVGFELPFAADLVSYAAKGFFVAAVCTMSGIVENLLRLAAQSVEISIERCDVRLSIMATRRLSGRSIPVASRILDSAEGDAGLADALLEIEAECRRFSMHRVSFMSLPAGSACKGCPGPESGRCAGALPVDG